MKKLEEELDLDKVFNRLFIEKSLDNLNVIQLAKVSKLIRKLTMKNLLDKDESTRINK